MQRGTLCRWGAMIALAAALYVTAAPARGGGCPGDDYCLGPRAKIVKGPAEKTTRTRATFKFTATDRRARFRCALDRGPFTGCSSPKKVRGLEPGKHLFRAQAVAEGGVAGPPAKYRWKVIER